MSTLIIYGGSLAHHGIKGQKWGERRFQNSDGSLTRAGKQRYGVGQTIRTAGSRLEARSSNRLANNYARGTGLLKKSIGGTIDMMGNYYGRTIKDVGSGKISAAAGLYSHRGQANAAGAVSEYYKMRSGATKSNVRSRMYDRHAENLSAYSNSAMKAANAKIGMRYATRVISQFNQPYTTIISGRKTTYGKEAVKAVLTLGTLNVAQDLGQMGMNMATTGHLTKTLEDQRNGRR